MRKGALTTGSMVCNSSPVDIRTVQLVPGTGLRYCGMLLMVWPPEHAYDVWGPRIGQPNSVLCRVSYWTGLICNCEVRRIGSTPVSTKGAMATGPAMVMRYSKLPCRLRSPPGVTSWRNGTGILKQLLAHAPEAVTPTGKRGLAGTKVESAFRSATAWVLGRYAMGETVRISKPRRSFS